jgi:hypothetical protein
MRRLCHYYLNGQKGLRLTLIRLPLCHLRSFNSLLLELLHYLGVTRPLDSALFDLIEEFRVNVCPALSFGLILYCFERMLLHTTV